MLTKDRRLLYERQAEIAKAIGHPLRVAIIDFLRNGEQCVCDIAENVGSERSNVSRHLSIMVKAGILEYHKVGLKVIYKLRTPCILEFFSCMMGVLRQQAEENEKLFEVIR